MCAGLDASSLEYYLVPRAALFRVPPPCPVRLRSGLNARVLELLAGDLSHETVQKPSSPGRIGACSGAQDRIAALTELPFGFIYHDGPEVPPLLMPWH